MRPALWLGLLVVSGASLAVSWLPAADEDLSVVPTPRVQQAVQPLPADRSAAAVAPPKIGAGARAPADTTPDTTPDSKFDAAPDATPSATPSATAIALAERTPWPALPPGARAAWLPAPPPPPRPPPPAAAPVVPPPAPPPAFGYQWLGQIEEDGQVRIFLSNAQRTLAPVLGEVIDQRWRLDAITADRLQLTWLPTGATVYVAGR